MLEVANELVVARVETQIIYSRDETGLTDIRSLKKIK